MSHPDPLNDPENTYPDDEVKDGAYHWQKAMDCMKLIEAQVADLKQMLKDYKMYEN
jgi:hypothetical protein